jgi:ribosomal protein S18 acetylase RimI-like enzyme
MSEVEVTLRRGNINDARFAASLHTSEIRTGFLSTLGPGFLTRLYRRIASTPGSFLLLAEAGDERVGFIAGSADLRRLYKTFLLRDGVFAAAGAVLHLLRSVSRTIETLRHGFGQSTDDEGAELLAIAVEPAWRERHVGRRLVAEFLNELKSLGATSAHVVVGSDNAPAIALYRSAGFGSALSYHMHSDTSSVVLRWGRGEQTEQGPLGRSSNR